MGPHFFGHQVLFFRMRKLPLAHSRHASPYGRTTTGSQKSIGGDKRVRTADPLLAKQVLSQLSYTPLYTIQWQSIPSKLNNVS